MRWDFDPLGIAVFAMALAVKQGYSVAEVKHLDFGWVWDPALDAGAGEIAALGIGLTALTATDLN